MKRVSGYLTVFLTMILTLLVSFSLGLIEGVRYNAVALESECVAEVAWNSVFAEYHRGMAERFNIFTLDASYGTNYASHFNIERHLKKYLDRNVKVVDGGIWDYLVVDFVKLSVTDVQLDQGMLLSDGNGAIFRAAAVNAVKDDMHLTTFEKVMEWVSIIQNNNLQSWSPEEQKTGANREIEETLQELQESGEAVSFENPTVYLEEVRRKGILSWVLQDEEAASVSGKVLQEESLFAGRAEAGTIGKGNMEVPELSVGEELTERFLFQEYLMRYFGNYLYPIEDTAVDYQIEYLIAGKSGDADNLRNVINRVAAIREAANAFYLFGSKEKSVVAETTALFLTSLIGLPELTGPVKVLLILGWSYAETLYDMEQLLEGKSVPLMKSDESWHYALENVLSGFIENASGESKQEQEGMSYEDYLRILMMLTNLQELTMRSMNLVEADIRLMPGNADFCLDHCYMELEAVLELQSDYGYDYKLRKNGSYLELK